MPRQKISQLDRNRYKCDFQNCCKSYPQQSALSIHKKNKHNSEQERRVETPHPQPKKETLVINKKDVYFHQVQAELQDLSEETFLNLLQQIKKHFQTYEGINQTFQQHYKQKLKATKLTFQNMKAQTQQWCLKEVGRLVQKHELQELKELSAQIEQFRIIPIWHHYVDLIWDLVYLLQSHLPSIANIIYLELLCILVLVKKEQAVSQELKRKIEEFRKMYKLNTTNLDFNLSDSLQRYVRKWLDIYKSKEQRNMPICLRKGRKKVKREQE